MQQQEHRIGGPIPLTDGYGPTDVDRSDLREFHARSVASWEDSPDGRGGGAQAVAALTPPADRRSRGGRIEIHAVPPRGGCRHGTADMDLVRHARPLEGRPRATAEHP